MRLLIGCRKYLADGNIDVRLATENVLAEFLREIKYIAQVQERQSDLERQRRDAEARAEHRDSRETERGYSVDGNDAVVDDDDDGDESVTVDGHGHPYDHAQTESETKDHWAGEGSGAWVPGQGVYVDHAAIMDIIIQHLSYPG